MRNGLPSGCELSFGSDHGLAEHHETTAELHHINQQATAWQGAHVPVSSHMLLVYLVIPECSLLP